MTDDSRRKRSRWTSDSSIESELQQLKAALSAQLASSGLRPSSSAASSAPSSAASTAEDAWFDPRLRVSSRDRQRALQFCAPGKFARQAQRLRLDQLSTDLRTVQATLGSSAGDWAPASTLLTRGALETVPEVEWWDRELVEEDGQATRSVFHPEACRPLGGGKAEAEPAALLLTERERKKLRRRRREEREREKRQRVALGLEAPPEDKLTLSSFMRILASESVRDPTAVEAKVRAQVERRRLAHELRNAEKKLSTEEKRQKERKRWLADGEKELYLAAFRIKASIGPGSRFKVAASAEKMNLTGVMLLVDGCNVVLVEGGPRAIRRFTRLMMVRIRWNEQQQHQKQEQHELEMEVQHPDEDQDDLGEQNDLEEKEYEGESTGCVQLFKGLAVKRQYPSFRVVSCSTELQGKRILADKGLANIWDLAKSLE